MRARAVRGLFVAVLVAQAALLARGYGDPHKLFAFQPFNDSDTWQAEIVRVTASGERLDVHDGTWDGYSWDELVGVVQLRHPARLRHANSGIDSTLAFLGRALDWVADHTPRDGDTVYLEATVTWYENGDGPHHTVLRSRRREEAR